VPEHVRAPGLAAQHAALVGLFEEPHDVPRQMAARREREHRESEVDERGRARLAAPSLNTRFQGIAPDEPFPVGRPIPLLIWVGAPIATDQWQSSRALRWNGDLSTTLELHVGVRAASLAWTVVAEQPTLLAEPWGSAQIARYQVLARRADRTKLAISVEHPYLHRPVQRLLLGVHVAATNGLAAPATLACRKCGAIPHAGAKFCPACGSPQP